MPSAATILPQFDHEMATTARVLRRVPGDRLEWRPHPKSMTLGQLAEHIAGIPGWVEPTMARDDFDLSLQPRPERATTTEALVARCERNAAAARAAIAAAPDEAFLQPWTLRAGDRVIVTMPRIAVLRGIVLSHLIHHRGELMVYLRLNDVPLPQVYGPTADEG